ncbi:Bardet-Biedl syndrome 4 protein [Globodera pallida]|nr:Bardet-Biedl syndrome 4 protein [Globodera pallida]
MEESKTILWQQFGRFRPPDRFNLLLYRFFVRSQFALCKQKIQDLLSESPEVLCEFALLLRGLIAREEGELGESVNWIGRALRHNPTKFCSNSERVTIFWPEHRKATELFAKALEQQEKKRNDNTIWKLYYWQSLSVYHVFQPPECAKKAQDALLSCPQINSSADMLMFLARLLGEQNEMGAAVEAYKRSIEMEPENVDLIHNLGMLYLKVEEQSNAFATFGKALSYDPNFVPSMLAIASIMQSNGDWDVSLTKYRAATSEFDHSCALWNNIGMCFFGKGKLLAALVCLNKANYLCPLDWKILINLALIYCALQQFASAYHFASAAFAITPQNPMVLCTMAVILTGLGDLRNAKAAYKRALKLEPSLWVIRFNLAIFESRRANYAEAIRRLTELEGDGSLAIGSLQSRAYPEELLQLVVRIRKHFEKLEKQQPKKDGGEKEKAPIRIEECAEDGHANDYANYLFDSDFTDSDHEDAVGVDEVAQVQIKHCSHRRKKVKSIKLCEIVDGLPVKRNMGAQKWRRVENAKLLTNFADSQDICFDGSDLIPETFSAFTRLLRDEAKMKVWNEFLEKDETGQKKMILQFEYEILMERDTPKAGRSVNFGQKAKDCLRKSPPEFSAENCFKRLDKKFRDCLLKRRNVQFDYLYKMEFVLREFFGESPADTFVEEIVSRIKRFHLHAVAQFLKLSSRTTDGENCIKTVHVKNEAANKFSPPDMYLATMLKKKRSMKAKDAEWEDDDLAI